MRREKTAVEWLVSRLKNLDTIDNKDIHQAKQMEKEQIEEAHKEGQHYANYFEVPHHRKAEQYYNETYDKDENKAENND